MRLAAVDEGTYVEYGSSNFLISGRGTFPLVSRLIGLLDGTRSLEDIEASVPHQARSLLRTLIKQLDAKDMLRAAAELGVSAPMNERDDGYAATRACFEDAEDSKAAFSRWRETPVVAAGNGVALRALIATLLASGVRTIYWLIEHGKAVEAEADEIACFCRDKVTHHPGSHTGATTIADAVNQTAWRIVYAADHVFRNSAVFAALIAHDRVGSVFAGVRDGLAMVGPTSVGDGRVASLWNQIAEPRHVIGHSEADLAMLGATAAHWLLRASVPSLRRSSESELVRLAPGGSLTHHPCPTGTTHLNWPLGTSGQSNPGQSGSFSALFDPLTGRLTWTLTSESDFPLPHWAVTLPCGTLVSGWAVTPQQTSRRAMLQATAVLLKNAAFKSPVTVSTSANGWCADAVAQAVVRSDDFMSRAQIGHVVSDEIQDEDSRRLLSLMQVYEASPTIWLAADRKEKATLACVAFGDCVTRAIAAEAEDAIREALGDALSMIQTGRVPHRQDHRLDDPRYGPWPGMVETVALTDQSGEVHQATTTLVPIEDRFLATMGIFAGYAEV